MKPPTQALKVVVSPGAGVGKELVTNPLRMIIAVRGHPGVHDRESRHDHDLSTCLSRIGDVLRDL